MRHFSLRSLLRSQILFPILAIAVLALCGRSVEGQKPLPMRFATQAGPVVITPIYHASLMIEAAGRHIYIDPAAPANLHGLPSADLILITHDHPDHMDPEAIRSLSNPGTEIWAPAAAARTLTSAEVIGNGETRSWQGWSIEAVPMYNLVHGPMVGAVFHPKGRGNGYVLTYGNKRFYLSGDTEATPEMAALKNIDVAFLSMNLPYTMSVDEAIQAAKSFKPKLLIPYHDRGSDVEALRQGLEGTGIAVRIVDWYANAASGWEPPSRHAQRPAGPIVPSPVVHGDRSVTFSLYAPRASTVTLSDDFSYIQNHSQPMKRDAHGEWSLTVPPLPPGFYSYFYRVDGVPIADPEDPDPKIGRQPQSAFEVPGAAADWLLAKLGERHGIVQIVQYDAQSIGRVERMHVYLPPGYRASDTKTRYPVLYLLMGGGDFDDVWISSGRANDIMDNLLAAKKAAPMIIVMPEVYVAPPGSPDHARNPELFGKELTSDIIPYIDRNYNTLATPKERALGGLSVPTVLTDVLFAHYATFNWVMFTGNGLSAEKIAEYRKQYPGLLDDPANVARVTYFIGDGVNAMTYAGSSNLAGELKAMGYHVTFLESPGIHGWPWFQLEFYQGVQTLFR